jgi:hypothetical protein
MYSKHTITGHLKTLEKTESHSRMDNPETLATLCTQNKEQRQTKQQTQHYMSNMTGVL